ncbi:uracil-DNA glycosylase [Rhodoferax sp.]|uniref:uracil-DNA glycosylase n=1 Tax=Rhodoferax sp. TaxID=50421 RepID=UPI0025CF6717|nr:uracil-DNA glycosylase [Rhodoferax sp.]
MPLFQEDCLQSWPPAAACVAPDWQPCVADFLASARGQQLGQFLNQRLAQKATIYPPHPLRALALTPLSAIKVVILGQDPYHGPGQAEGLAFSVAPGIQPPPSLRNIFKELQQEGMPPRAPGGSLAAWAEQGVLLLNACLTVEDGLPASHAKRGWEALTDAVVMQVAQTAPVCVYLLWGAHAQTKAPLVQQLAANYGNQILVLQSNHPSPLSAMRPPAPFIGCGHFQRANSFLTQLGATAIDWPRTA